jgi:hypothetical protein
MMPSGLPRLYRNGDHKKGRIAWSPSYVAQEVRGASRTITKYGMVPNTGVQGSAAPPAINAQDISRGVARACDRDA